MILDPRGSWLVILEAGGGGGWAITTRLCLPASEPQYSARSAEGCLAVIPQPIASTAGLHCTASRCPVDLTSVLDVLRLWAIEVPESRSRDRGLRVEVTGLESRFRNRGRGVEGVTCEPRSSGCGADIISANCPDVASGFVDMEVIISAEKDAFIRNHCAQASPECE